MDGTMIHIRSEGWKELKVGSVFEIGTRIMIDPEVKTTRKTGGLTWPYKGLLLAAPQGAAFSSFKLGAPIT